MLVKLEDGPRRSVVDKSVLVPPRRCRSAPYLIYKVIHHNTTIPRCYTVILSAVEADSTRSARVCALFVRARYTCASVHACPSYTGCTRGYARWYCRASGPTVSDLVLDLI